LHISVTYREEYRVWSFSLRNLLQTLHPSYVQIFPSAFCS
jgi:hypothetical protein